MKIAKYFLIAIIAVIAVLLITGLFLPTDVHVERSIVIHAPREIVHNQIRSLKNMDDWSPWKEYDPAMTVSYEGADGEVGSVSYWEGNDDVGKGSQEIISITDSLIETKVNIIKPWQSEMKASFILAPEEDGVKATWASDGTTPYPMNVFSLFMSMDDMIGKDFEKGLLNLKEKSESLPVPPKTYRGYTIVEIEKEPVVYLAKKGSVPFDKVGDFYRENIPAILQAAGDAGVEISGSPSGLYYRWDEENKMAEMAAAFPVLDSEKISSVKDFERIDVAGSKALHIKYYGGYEKSEDAHYAMDDYMKEKGLQYNGEVIEEYVTGPGNEADTSKWATNIYYLVK